MVRPAAPAEPGFSLPMSRPISSGLFGQKVAAAVTRVPQADAVVIGSGSGGGVAAMQIAEAGLSVVLVEQGRIGGECHYVACVPSKSLLHSARTQRDHPQDPRTAWEQAIRRRDEDAGHRDDTAAVESMRDSGVQIIRGTGRFAAADTLAVETDGGERFPVRWGEAVVIATGSEPVLPPVDGLPVRRMWTSEQALSSPERPRRLLILGGGPVGCEAAQAYASFGTEVTLVETAPGLLPNEQPGAGSCLGEALRELGVEVRVGVTATRVSEDEDRVTVRMDVGSDWSGDRLLLAGGRRPTTAGLGLEHLGVTPGEDGAVEVDLRCRVKSANGGVVPGVFAVGDVTGAAPYTHTANAQARTLTGELTGRGRDVPMHAVARAVYTDPAVWCIGLTEKRAEERGIRVHTASFELHQLQRASLEDAYGRVELLAADDGTLVGAAVVGPGADSWAAPLQIALQLGCTVEQLGDTPFCFPSLPEALGIPARELAERLRRSPRRPDPMPSDRAAPPRPLRS